MHHRVSRLLGDEDAGEYLKFACVILVGLGLVVLFASLVALGLLLLSLAALSALLWLFTRLKATSHREKENNR